MADRTEQPHTAAALVLVGLILAGLAAGVAATWVNDGDGTCGAIYRPNLARVGCSWKLMPAGVVSAVLVGGAVLVWDAARRTDRRPGRGTAVVVAIGVVAVCGFFGIRSFVDPRARAGQDPGARPPATAPPPMRPPQ